MAIWPSYTRAIDRVLDLEPLDATFGATLRAVELRSLDAETWQAIRAAWIEYGLLIFEAQYLNQDEQNEFALRVRKARVRSSGAHQHRQPRKRAPQPE